MFETTNRQMPAHAIRVRDLEPGTQFTRPYEGDTVYVVERVVVLGHAINIHTDKGLVRGNAAGTVRAFIGPLAR